ncbi:MAG: hypothetical protein JW973_16040 [Bacteroidales bacterium]|nr:hypothetical protein [Bacteroidales bacterium]
MRFKYLTVDEGLTHNMVITACQDAYGFIWFGTSSGLNKFDGYELINYLHKENDPTTISGDRIEIVFCDSRKALWIGTHYGLHRYNYDNNTFIHFTHSLFPDGLGRINDMAEDENGILWMASWSGLIMYDPLNNTIQKYIHNADDPSSLPHDNLSNIAIDDKNNPWVSTYNQGVARLDRKSGKFERYRNDPDDPESISEDRVETIYKDREGNIWFGTYNKGANLFIPYSLNFKRYYPDYSVAGSGRVRAFFEDDEDNLWLGTQTGLYFCNRETGTFFRYAYTDHPFSTLSHNSIQCAMIDNNDGLWLGTFAGGVSYSNLNVSGITLYEYSNLKSPYYLNDKSVYCFVEDAEGNIWIGTEQGGLNYLNRNTGLFTYYIPVPGDPNSLRSANIKDILLDRDNNLWIATNQGGLSYFNTATKRFTNYLYDPDDPGSIASNNVYDLYMDEYENLWIGTLHGICLKTPYDKGFLRLELDPNVEGAENLESYGYIETLISDKNGMLWGAGPGIPGILQINPETRLLTVIQKLGSLNLTTFSEIHCDANGYLWFSLNEETLVRLNPDGMNYVEMGPSQGYPKISVMAILDDPDGNLWISSNDGLFCFYDLVSNQDTLRYKRYSRYEGLQSRQFILNSKMVNREGEFFFGGVNGFNTFVPSKVRENPYPPLLVFTDFRVNNKSVKVNEVVGGKRLLKKSILETKEIRINHRIKTFTIVFSGLHYVAPEQNRYAYKLEGFDDWTYVNASSRFASYSNLSPGKYIFMVKASNNSGLWNEEPIRLTIVVKPPFWRTIWFYLLIIILLSALIMYFISWREKRLKEDKLTLETRLRQGEEELQARKEEIEKQQKMLADKEKAEYEIRWYNDGLAKFSEILSKEKNNLNNLCRDFISNLTSYVGALQGGIYIVNNNDSENIHLELAASNVFNRERLENISILPGEGLVGACFKSQEIMEITDVPDNYLKIGSGLGEQKPAYLLLIPVKYNIDTEGVIELASFQRIEHFKIRFIEKLSEMLVPIISSFKASIVIKEMYAKTREQSEELQAQEEEMRQNMEEMRATQEESERIKSQLLEQLDKLKKENQRLKTKPDPK